MTKSTFICFLLFIIYSINSTKIYAQAPDITSIAKVVAVSVFDINKTAKFAPSKVNDVSIAANYFTYLKFKVNDDGVLLSWKITAPEVVKKFFIERSQNGIDFSIIGNIECSSENDIYTWEDYEPTNDRNYYRIRAVVKTNSKKDI